MDACQWNGAFDDSSYGMVLFIQGHAEVIICLAPIPLEFRLLFKVIRSCYSCCR